MRVTRCFSLFAVLLLLSGCSVLTKAIFGIEEIKKVDYKRIEAFLVESQQMVACTQIVASTSQVDSIIRLDLDSNQMQHRGQPVQILYFEDDSLFFWHINCYTQSGFLSYDWNNHGYFNHFPPSPTVVEDSHHSMTLDRYRTIIPELKSTTRYTVILQWCNVLPKVSIGAVKALATNIGNRNDCTVYLLNTDQWWVNYLNKK